MRALRSLLDRIAPAFEHGGPLAFLYPFYEATDTMLFTPGTVTRSASHVRDGIDLKRMMFFVIIALIPSIIMALYNTGYQAQVALAQGAVPLDNWQTALYLGMGLEYAPSSIWLTSFLGALYFLPVLIVSYGTGLSVEAVFARIRGHDIAEGFLVTGMLIPLILPPTIPLWQVALGTAFGVVFGKEIFGGVGMNFLNPALVTRAFLFFAYPAEISGEAPWIAANFQGVDTFTGATLLAQSATTPGVLEGADWMAAFLGRIPGSMGETSALACLAGGVFLIITRVGSWRTISGVVLGSWAMVALLNWAGSDTNPMFAMPFHWHIVLGGWAFGAVFMATDPVSSAFTASGKWVYGVGIGLLAILIRVINPAYPEGMMLAILFMNMFAPLIDHFVVRANVRRREARYAA